MQRRRVLPLLLLVACAGPGGAGPPRDTRSALRVESLLEQELRRVERQLGPEAPETSAALHRLADHFRAGGRSDEARLLVESSLARREAALGAQHPSLADSLLWLAAQSDEPEPAVAYAERARALLESAPGPALAAALDPLAELERRRGRADRAVPLAERAVTLLESAPAPRPLALASALRTLGRARLDAGAYAAAGEPLERALALLEADLGREDPRLAGCLAELAARWLALGEPQRAISLLERALELEPGASAPLRAERLDALAAAERAAGDPSRALRHLERARRIRERSHGPGSPEVALSTRRLAEVNRALGYRRRAREQCRHAREIDVAELGADHPRVADGWLCEAALAEPQDALPLVERAQQILEAAHGEEHAAVAEVRQRRGALLAASGDAAAARHWLERALHSAQAALGPDHPRLLGALDGLAELAGSGGDRERAEALLRGGLAIREAAYGPRHLEVARAAARLAGLHYADPRPGPARSLYQRALDIYVAHGETLAAAEVSGRLAGLAYAGWQLDRAEALYARSHRLYAGALGKSHPLTRTAEQHLERVRATRRAYAAPRGPAPSPRTGSGYNLPARR